MSNAESFTLIGISLATIGLRTWYRWSQIGFAGFQLDDYVMPVAGVLFCVVAALAYTVGATYGGLTNSYMTDEERAALDPNSREAFNREMGSKIQVTGWSLYTMELWVLKVCITAFYSRLTERLNNLNTQIKIAYGFIGVSYLVVALSILLGCQPFYKNWQINPDPGNLCQPTNSNLNVFMVYVFDILTDFYLLSIPLPLLWRVNITMRRKVTLMILFSGAIFVIVAATIRAVVIVTAGIDGALVTSAWAVREIFVSTIVTNIPVLHPLIRKAASAVGLGSLLRSRRTRSASGTGGGLGGTSGNTNNNKKSSRSNRSNSRIIMVGGLSGGGPGSGTGKDGKGSSKGRDSGIIRGYRMSSNPLHKGGNSASNNNNSNNNSISNSRSYQAYGSRSASGGSVTGASGGNTTTGATSTAWDSDEHILLQGTGTADSSSHHHNNNSGSNSNSKTSSDLGVSRGNSVTGGKGPLAGISVGDKEIMVGKEFTIVTETRPPGPTPPPAAAHSRGGDRGTDFWGYPGMRNKPGTGSLSDDSIR